MSAAVTDSGAMERARKKCSVFLGERTLTCPYPSTMFSLARM